MNLFKLIQSALIMFVLPNFGIFGQMIENPEHDKSLSPFFFVKSENPDIDQLPLKSTSADVNIAGVIADVRVVQIYKNEGQSVLEAIYIFPASTRAAVYDMTMTLGERIIKAEIKKRDDARQDYEQAVREGRTASLLEQQRPNVFQMNVGNILPGDEIKVELSYTELLLAEEKTYEFVYPTVVGPRYSNQSINESQTDKWVKNPYLQESEDPTYRFDIKVHVGAGMPIKDIFSPSHQLDIDFKDKNEVMVKLPEGENSKGDRDFILKYRLNGDEITPGLLLHRGEKENFFLMMIQPPKRIKIEEIPSREYIFIVDVSGSMNGFPLDISKELLRNLIGNLQKGDKFNVLLFAAGSRILSEESLPANEENINRAIRLIEGERGGGGTELLPALKRALALPRNKGISRTVVIATDGYVHVEKEAFDLIRKNLGKANMFPFGIGSSVNRFLIEGMARAGMGESFVITRVDDANKIANKFRNYISSPVLTRVSYEINGFDIYDVEPASVPDVFAERPVLLFGKWRGNPEGEITVRGLIGQREEYAKTISVSNYQTADRNRGLKYLWARYKIAILGDYNNLNPDDERIKEITTLGLTYSLLTEYTSFIAADTRVRNEGGKTTTVQQPLPLPHGVSNLALASGSAGSGGYRMGRSKLYPTAPALETMDISEAEDDKKAMALTVHVDIQTPNLERHNSNLENQIQNHLKELEYCDLKFNKAGTSGILKFEVSLSKKNEIIEVKIIGNNSKNNEYAKCLAKRIKNLKLVTPDKTQDVIFVLKLKFER